VQGNSAAEVFFFFVLVIEIADEVGSSPIWQALAGPLFCGDRLTAIDAQYPAVESPPAPKDSFLAWWIRYTREGCSVSVLFGRQSGHSVALKLVFFQGSDSGHRPTAEGQIIRQSILRKGVTLKRTWAFRVVRQSGSDCNGLSENGAEDVVCGRAILKMPTAIRKSPVIAPQGQGPLGGRSRCRSGIHPVEPTRTRGKAKILAIVAPERDQKSRKQMAQYCFTRVILNGNLNGGKVT